VNPSLTTSVNLSRLGERGMIFGMSHQTIILMAAVKGIIMAVVLTVIAETTFLQGLATAILSAAVSGTFLLISVHMTTRRTEEKIERVKEKIEVQEDSGS
jgi:hypothetical protein